MELLVGGFFTCKYPQYTFMIRTVIRLLFNTFRLGKELCSLCEENLYDTRQHILFQCCALTADRRLLWKDIVTSCPQANG